MASDPRPPDPLVGNIWEPHWPGEVGLYRALGEVSDSDAYLWQWLHRRTAQTDYRRPTYYSRPQLAAVTKRSVRSVTRSLRVLREHDLLYEVERGEEPKSRRHRPPARWALDPFADEIWRPVVEEALARVAEEDGQSHHWHERAVNALDDFHRRSRLMRARLAEDMPFQPKDRRKRKGKKKKQTAASVLAPGARLAHEGGFYTRGVGSEAAKGVSPNGTGPE